MKSWRLTLTLECDWRNPEGFTTHDPDTGRAEFTGNTRDDCERQARVAGWSVNTDRQASRCPKHKWRKAE
jgi:hypothetical protein